MYLILENAKVFFLFFDKENAKVLLVKELRKTNLCGSDVFINLKSTDMFNFLIKICLFGIS